MVAYIIRRVLLMVPTLIGIMLLSFIITQFAPGGPVEQMIAQLSGQDVSALERITGSEGGDFAGQETGARPDDSGQVGQPSGYRGAQGLRPEILARIEQQFGFDKPPVERFLTMMWNYIRFDFGDSYFRGASVVDLIVERLPVSISLGFWMLLISYSVSIPLGIAKAVRDGSSFDIWTSGVILIGVAIPGFLLAILLIVVFAGGSFFDVFPLRGLVSENWASLPWHEQVLDYLWHIVLPITAMAISSFATLTLLTKNSFLDEINKQYVMTARAKGLTEGRVLYGHIFRNAMLIVIAGFPGLFLGVFFGSSLIIEFIFSLDGLGQLGYRAAVERDYPVIFGTLFAFGLIGLVVGIISDLMYVLVDPRIDFERRG